MKLNDKKVLRKIVDIAVDMKNVGEGKSIPDPAFENNLIQCVVQRSMLFAVCDIFDLNAERISDYVLENGTEPLEAMGLEEFLGRFGDSDVYEYEYLKLHYSDEEIRDMEKDREMERFWPTSEEYYPPDPPMREW